jgi:TolB-like protein/Tfp pilus assembly protein PilF
VNRLTVYRLRPDRQSDIILTAPAQERFRLQKTQDLDSGGHETQPPAAPSPEAVREQLDRILSSQTFRSAEGQRNFLRYAVEQVVLGQGDRLKEYAVGTEVFGRGDSFDPRLDTIVRTEARKLRSRLAKYYETEGAQDTLRIDLPKGSYAPLFRSVVAAAVVAEKDVEALETELKPDAELKAAPEPAHPADPHPATKWRRIGLIVAGITVAVSLIVTARLLFRGTGTSTDTPSIAVLPFVNMSDDKQDEFFSDGLTEELIDSFARVPGLHVVARTSVFQYKGKPIDVRRIGRELNVRTVFEGSVRKYGDRLRITAQLNDAANGYHLWSQSYDRELKDTLAIQREISQAITAALGVKLAPQASAAVSNALPNGTPPLQPEAYQNYLKGRYFLSKYTAEGNKTALAYFEQAIREDPNYAPAYVGLANCYADAPVYIALPLDVIPKIREAASKALELDPSLGEAHIALAQAFEYDLNWPAAAEEFKQSLKLSPGNADAHRRYASYLTTIGNLDGGLAESKIALELDPVSPYMAQGLARTFFHMHRFDDAIREYQKALALEPNFGRTRQGLGRAYLFKGDYTDGLRETQKGLQLMGDDSVMMSQLGYAYAVSGNTAEAQRILAGFLEKFNHGGFSARAIAEVYIGLKDRDRAFEWLRRAVDQKEVNVYLKTEPVYDALRSDPRFADLLRRQGPR